MSKGFFIGELSRRTDVPTQTIRYYERLGLIRRPERTDSGYRLYSEADEERLCFIQRAKALGLSLDEVRELLALRAAGTMPCRHLKELMDQHLRDLDRRIKEMQTFRNELKQRYERLNSLTEVPGVVCGFIERDGAESEGCQADWQ